MDRLQQLGFGAPAVRAALDADLETLRRHPQDALTDDIKRRGGVDPALYVAACARLDHARAYGRSKRAQTQAVTAAEAREDRLQEKWGNR